MWNTPDRVEIQPLFMLSKDTSDAAILAHITKLRNERLSWPVIAKAVGLKERDALARYVRSQM
jgi:hypothetical protein